MISSIKYAKDTKTDIIAIHANSSSPYKITLPVKILGYCETNARVHPTQRRAVIVNNILNLLDAFESIILIEDLSVIIIINDSKRNLDYFTKTL